MYGKGGTEVKDIGKRVIEVRELWMQKWSSRHPGALIII